MKKFRIHLIPGFLFLIGILSACNKNFDTVLKSNYADSANFSAGIPKVLYLIVDGARGVSVRDAKTPNIYSLLPHAIYSWNSVSDEAQSSQAGNWADMLTGVRMDKHKVTSNDLAGNNFDQYPIFFKRVKAAKPSLKMASFSSSALFNNNFTEGIDEKKLLNDDEAVKSALVENLQSDTASFVVGQFSAIKTAGENFGYDISVPEYKAAIQTFDNYFGEILTALKKRPTYNDESWLIIITSPSGGPYEIPPAEDDQTIFSNPDVNTFTIYYNKDYKPQAIAKPFLGNEYNVTSLHVHGQYNQSSAVNASLSDAADFNMGADKEFTIQFKLKKSHEVSWWWYYDVSFLSKRSSNTWTSSTPGWNLTLYDVLWGIDFTAGSTRKTIYGGYVSEDVWHDMAIVCRVSEGKRYLSMYVDGVKNTNYDSSNDYVMPAGSLNNNDPLVLGYVRGNVDGKGGGTDIDIHVTDLKFFNKALTPEIINQFKCEAYIDEGHPAYDNLLGYWPLTDGSGSVIKDKGALGHDLKVNGTPQWDNLHDLLCSPSSNDLGANVPRNPDIVPTILSWMRIPQQTDWVFDGRIWFDQ